MAVQALDLNFTGFIEREDLINYKNLFVREIPELKGKPLCEYLTNLDQAEYRLVSAENQEFTQDVSVFWDKRGIVVHLLTAVYLGITILFHKKLGLLPVNLYKIFHVAGVVACFVSLTLFLALGYAPMYEQIAMENKVHRINESRKIRLVQKLNAVRTEYRKLKDASPSLDQQKPPLDQQKPQQIELRDAKRFLKDRVESIPTNRSLL